MGSHFNPANFEQLSVALDVLRFVTRNSVHTAHPKAALILRPWFDEILTSAWANAKRAKISIEGFVELESTVVPLVLNMKKVQAVLDAGDNLENVAS